MPDSLVLHSGDYVERYKRKSLRRVQNLADRMTIEPGAEIADFACGNGMLLHALPQGFGTYHGVDFSPDFIRAAEEWAQESGWSNWRFHCRDVIRFCEQHPARFDVAAALDFSEHIADAEAVAIFWAIRGSMRPGSRFYLHSPNREFVVEALKERGILKQFPEHIAVRTGEEMLQLLIAAGFARDQIRVETIAHYNILALLHPLGRIPIIGRFFRARLWITARI